MLRCCFRNTSTPSIGSYWNMQDSFPQRMRSSNQWIIQNNFIVYIFYFLNSIWWRCTRYFRRGGSAPVIKRAYLSQTSTVELFPLVYYSSFPFTITTTKNHSLCSGIFGVHRKNYVVESRSLPSLFLHNKFVFVWLPLTGRRFHESCSLFLTSGALQFVGKILWM